MLLRLLILLMLLPAALPAEVVARYDRGEITRAEVRAFSQLREFNYDDPWATYHSATDEATRADARYFLDAAVDDLIFDRVLAAEARQAGFLNKPSSDEIALPATRAGECLVAAWRTEVADEVTTLTERQLARWWQEHRQTRVAPERRDVSYIFFSGHDTFRRRELQEIRTAILAGETTFREAAYRYSEAPSASTYGSIGQVTREARFRQEFTDLIFSTDPGTISPVTRLWNGWYLVEIRGAFPAVELPETPPVLGTPEADRFLGNQREDHVRARIATLRAEQGRPANTTDFQLIRATGFAREECALIESLGKERLLAQGWFLHRYEPRFVPTEEEIADWAEKNSAALRPDGQFKLTRYTVLLGTGPDARIRSRQEAIKAATELYHAFYARNMAMVSAAERAGVLEISDTVGWVMGSGSAQADSELLELQVGELTSPIADTRGAVFFRLEDRRAMEVQDIETHREMITENVRNRKMWTVRDELRARTLATLKVVRLY